MTSLLDRKHYESGAQSSATFITDKIALRDWLLDEIPSSHYVLDLYAGFGDMYKAVWHKADFYFGIECSSYKQRKHPGKVICVKWQRYFPIINLSKFNIVDIDSWGWGLLDAFQIIIPALPTGFFGIAITHCNGMDIVNQHSNRLRKYLNYHVMVGDWNRMLTIFMERRPEAGALIVNHRTILNSKRRLSYRALLVRKG